MKIDAVKNEYGEINSDKDAKKDYIERTIGAFGAWQAIVCLISLCLRMIAVINLSTFLFLTPSTEFKCVRFGKDQILNVLNSTCYDDCKEYVYYDIVFEDSVVSTFGLICRDQWFASLLQSIMMLGLLTGCFLFGWISDRFGRRIAFILTTFVAVLFMIPIPFAHNYWTMNALRFCTGVGCGGISTLSVVVSVEIVGSQHKDTVGSFVTFADLIGTLVMILIAYYTSTWKMFLLVCAIFSSILFALVFFVTESPRWLIANKRGEEAIELMSKIAKFNKITNIGINDIVNNTLDDMKNVQMKTKRVSYYHLFGSKKIAKISVCSMMQWFLGGVCLYGIYQYASFLRSDIYLVIFIYSLFEGLSTPIAVIVNKYIRRKLSVTISFCAVGAAMFFLMSVPKGHWCCILLSAIGIGSAKLVICIIYVQVNELYPTPLRNMGFSFSAAGAKSGAIVAPFIANLRPPWIACVIFIVIPIVGIFFSSMLPETKGKKLQDTIN